MYRSKEKLLESVDESESILSTYRSRKQGLSNRSFENTTESSFNSNSPRNPQITVENAEVYRPEDSSKPVPLPRSRIPKLLPKDSSSKHPPASSAKIKTKREETLSREDTIEPESTEYSSSSVPLTTFVVKNEKKKNNRRKYTNLQESSIVSSTDDLSSSGDTKKDDQAEDETVPSVTEHEEQRTKKHRKKKLIKSRSKSKDSEEMTDRGDSSIGIYIHDLDFLKFSLELESVQVRVSAYDQSNGHLLVKSRRKIDDGQPKEMEPLLTKTCRFENLSYLHCIWEELLLIEENVKVLRNEHSILCFEILLRLECSVDFKTVAWAFLKPFHENKFDNFDKRLKLQVYHFNKKMNLFHNWRNVKQYGKYPSTLSITLKQIKRDKNLEASEETKEDEDQKEPFDIAGIGYSNKTFKRPNQIVSHLNLPGKGTNLVKLNYTGDLVAITNPSEDGSNDIVICTLPDLRIVQKLEGHSDFIYDMNWKKDSNYPQTLITCSADHILLIWKIEKDFHYSVKVIPHVTFIYCCQFWTNQGQEFILTAGKDGIIRVWQPFKGSFKIFQEVSKGTGYITSLALGRGSTIFSGSSEGRVVEWKWSKSSFEYSRTIHEDKSPIAYLELHPRIEKIFIGKQIGEILCMDLESLIIIQSFQMGHNDVPRRFFKFRISNCGMFLISVAGGQDVNCWNILTGIEETSFDFITRPLGVFSSIDMPIKGSFIILGRYLTNKSAVIVVKNSDSMPLKAQLIAEENKNLMAIQEREDRGRTTAVLPQLCDDEKITLSKDMVDEKKRIEDWLDKNVAKHPESAAGEDSDGGTFVVERQESIKSNGTYTVEVEEKPKGPRKPRRKNLVKQQKRVNSTEDELDEVKSTGTYEIKKKKDTDADDTSVSDSVFA